MKIKNDAQWSYHLGGLVFPAGMTVDVTKQQIEGLEQIDAYKNALENGLSVKGRRKPKKSVEEE